MAACKKKKNLGLPGGQTILQNRLRRTDRHAKRLKDGEGVAFDVSDISKLYGGEGMAMVYDGSAHEPRMGHLFAAATSIPNSNLVPMPLCVRLQRGKHGANELLKGVVQSVMEVSGKRPVGVVDRGELFRSPNALLANVRELLKRRGLRHITGRPPRRAGPPPGGPVQRLLPLPAYYL